MQKHEYKADSNTYTTIGLDYGTFHLINVLALINLLTLLFMVARGIQMCGNLSVLSQK